MSSIEAQDVLSGTTAEHGDNDNVKLVPVAESIRYRKRAQSAEKEVEMLTEQLAQAESQAKKVTEQLNDVQTEQKLMRKLAAVGVVDLETAVLIAKDRIKEQDQADLDGVVERLRREKQYLFASGNGGSAAAKRTAVAKDRIPNSRAVLERAAKKAATTGNRADLQEYLKLRRNFM